MNSNNKMFPESAQHRARLQALRGVALLEFVKGVAVLAAAISLYWLDPTDVADAFLGFLHISPDHHLARMLMGLADRLSDVTMWHVMLGACSYSGLRFAEAYGLWKARAWAEWIALVSGAIYLPFEIRLLAHRVSLLHVSVLLINIAIVIFMFYLRIYVPRHEPAATTGNL
ncbi:MAG TPA: DUF2127 domain-containing protein [Terriglobales bacterium]|nr:DUF2127 domain-containing protein [Terriglobales bacterium]